jgi:hypothetical protein
MNYFSTSIRVSKLIGGETVCGSLLFEVNSLEYWQLSVSDARLVRAFRRISHSEYTQAVFEALRTECTHIIASFLGTPTLADIHEAIESYMAHTVAFTLFPPPPPYTFAD